MLVIDSVVLHKIFYVEVLCINYSGSDIDLEVNEEKGGVNNLFKVHESENRALPDRIRRIDSLNQSEANVLNDKTIQQSFSMNQANLDRTSQLKKEPKSKVSIINRSQSRVSLMDSPSNISDSLISIDPSFFKNDYQLNKR